MLVKSIVIIIMGVMYLILYYVPLIVVDKTSFYSFGIIYLTNTAALFISRLGVVSNNYNKTKSKYAISRCELIAFIICCVKSTVVSINRI